MISGPAPSEKDSGLQPFQIVSMGLNTATLKPMNDPEENFVSVSLEQLVLYTVMDPRYESKYHTEGPSLLAPPFPARRDGGVASGAGSSSMEQLQTNASLLEGTAEAARAVREMIEGEAPDPAKAAEAVEALRAKVAQLEAVAREKQEEPSMALVGQLGETTLKVKAAVEALKGKQEVLKGEAAVEAVKAAVEAVKGKQEARPVRTGGHCGHCSNNEFEGIYFEQCEKCGDRLCMEAFCMPCTDSDKCRVLIKKAREAGFIENANLVAKETYKGAYAPRDLFLILEIYVDDVANKTFKAKAVLQGESRTVGGAVLKGGPYHTSHENLTVVTLDTLMQEFLVDHSKVELMTAKNLGFVDKAMLVRKDSKVHTASPVQILSIESMGRYFQAFGRLEFKLLDCSDTGKPQPLYMQAADTFYLDLQRMIELYVVHVPDAHRVCALPASRDGAHAGGQTERSWFGQGRADDVDGVRMDPEDAGFIVGWVVIAPDGERGVVENTYDTKEAGAFPMGFYKVVLKWPNRCWNSGVSDTEVIWLGQARQKYRTVDPEEALEESRLTALRRGFLPGVEALNRLGERVKVKSLKHDQVLGTTEIILEYVRAAMDGEKHTYTLSIVDAVEQLKFVPEGFKGMEEKGGTGEAEWPQWSDVVGKTTEVEPLPTEPVGEKDWEMVEPKAKAQPLSKGAKRKAKGGKGAKEVVLHEDGTERTNKRNCVACGLPEKWRSMRGVPYSDYQKEIDAAETGDISERSAVRKLIEEGKYVFDYVYTCYSCVAKEQGITVHEAIRAVKKPRTDKMVERAERFTVSMERVQDLISFVALGLGDTVPATGEEPPKDGTEKSKLKKDMYKEAKVELVRMKVFFAPIMKFLALKKADEVNAAKAARWFAVWMDDHPESSKDDVQAGLVRDELMDMAMNEWRAFKEASGGDVGLQTKFCAAADYSDQWFADAMGGGRFRTFYSCKAKTGEYIQDFTKPVGEEWVRGPCGILTESDKWDRLQKDPLAKKQRWYCPCHAKYNTRFGMVCELELDDVPHYCWAEFPPQGILDLKFLSVEEMAKKLGIKMQTPEDLYANIPKVSPLAVGQGLEEVEGRTGSYKFTGMNLEDLPTLTWEQLFNMVVAEDDQKGAKAWEGAASSSDAMITVMGE